MALLPVIFSSFLIILPAALAAPAETGDTTPTAVIQRDQWWIFKDTFVDAPRIFFFGEDDVKCPGNADFVYLDCNRCNCRDGIVDSCSRMGCFTPQIANWEEGKECPAGQEFYFKCNDCTCHANGTSATCTDKPCPEPTHD